MTPAPSGALIPANMPGRIEESRQTEGVNAAQTIPAPPGRAALEGPI